MDSRTRDDINLRPLFQKLGHNLEEIRARALQNISSKLEHKLLCDADLVQEKHLHIRLLEWFNFPSCPLQEEALNLINRLCQHPSAAKIYLDIGAIEFLNQLRPNIKDSFHRLVDSILDNLYHIPEVPEQHEVDCIVYRHQAGGHQHTGEQFSQALPEQFLVPPSSSEKNYIAEPSIAPGTGFQQYPSPPDQQGYFGPHGEETPRVTHYTTASVPAAVASCFKFSTFPWIPLTPTDRHVMSSTDNSLRSNDHSLVVSACEFLSDVVFKDFPAEVFLQRPGIIKSLLSLLAVPASDASNIAVHATSTLRELTSSLGGRIYYHQDPALYTPKQDFPPSSLSSSSTASFLSHSLGSSDSRPSVIGHGERQGGDGQDGDNSTNSGGSQNMLEGDMVEQTDVEDIQSLQFMQWTTPQFCLLLFEKLLPCFKTPHGAFITQSLDLFHQVVALLKETVSSSALWEDNSVPAREVIEKFHDILEMLGDVLFLHHHSNLSAATPVEEIEQHRIAFIGISVFIIQFIQTMVPKEKVNEAIPQEYTAVLTMIGFDEPLYYSFPNLREMVLQYLQEIDEDSYNTFNHAQNICLSLTSTCAFLLDSDEITDGKLLTLLSHAEEGVSSLIYHLNMKFVDGCVKLASYICTKTSPNPNAVQQSRSILLSLLAHPLPSVRSQAYSTMLATIREALGVEHVTEPATSATLSMVFVIDRQVLYEVCCFGMNDSEAKVTKVAEEIMVCLLQSQLLLSAPRWQQLLEAISAVLPVLQGFASLETTLGKCILGLLDTDSHLETGMLPVQERFRGTLRLMFNKQSRIRSEGLGRLAWFLANEMESIHKLPQFSQLQVENMANMMILEQPRSLIDEDTSRSVFQVESLKKVYEILINEDVELSVRKSAAEQLAIILQDQCLQRAFQELGGVEKLMEYASIGVRKPSLDNQQPLMSPMLPPILKMLRCLVQCDFGLRHKLAHEASMYYIILRSCLLHHKNITAKQEVAELLTLLLFDEVASIQTWTEDLLDDVPGKNFSLPSFIVKKYSLPMIPQMHHTLSPHRGPLPPESDPLTSGPLMEMLHCAWNTAWAGSVQDAIKPVDSQDEDTFSSSMLSLSKVERTILECSYIPNALQQCVFNVENATGHSSVTKTIRRLTSYLVSAGPYDITGILHTLKWREAVSRFLLVVPSSSADEQLLTEILLLLYHILQSGPLPPMEVVTWVGNALHNHKGALLGLMSRTEAEGDDLPETTLLIRRQLNKHLLRTVEMYVGKYPYSLVDRSSYECVRGDLSLNVLARINRSNAAQFYNLAALESTLSCLMHITARPGWSLESREANSLTLCFQMLTSLLEVVSAFHLGRGGMSMSYMGRGITRCATLCLRHLAYEMATQLHSKDWPRNWLFSRQATPDSVGESGLHWLIPLWNYRDTEVRAAGVGIAAALGSTEAGRITMTTQCQDIPGGIWGGAFSALLDQSECSIVRQQAALLLVNMTSQPMPSGSVETTPDVWQGPIVRNEETQVSLVGLSALLALLHHSHFYHAMIVLLSNFYPQPAIHPVSIAGASRGTTPLGSQTTMTTSGSISAGRLSRLAEITSSSHLMTSTPAIERPALVGQNGDAVPHSQSAQSASTLHVTGQSSASQGADFVSVGSNRPTTSQGVGTDGHDRQEAIGEPSPGNPTALNTNSGAPGVDVSSSGSSQVSRGEYQSVATPSLVSAVCHLLSNLVALAPHDTLSSMAKENMHKILISILDVNLLEAYVCEMKSTDYRAQYLLAFQNLLRLHMDILALLRKCVIKDLNMRTHILEDKNALKQLAKLLAISLQDDADTAELCCGMWESVFTFFSTLLQAGGQEALHSINPILVKHWKTIAGRAVNILQDSTQFESNLWLASLHFLAILLTEEGKRQVKGGKPDEKTVKDRLDNPVTNDEGDIFQSSSGSLLCQSLVKNYDSVIMKPLEQCFNLKLAVVNALKSLLTISESAKMAALEAGLVETICDHIKHLTVKLNMDALELGNQRSTKKKDNPIMSELMLAFDLLRNFMFNSNEVKVASNECGLSQLVHRVWAWGLMEPALMSCLLSTLLTYTARCPQAASSLAFSSTSVVDRSVTKAQHSNTPLVLCLIKLVQRETTSGNLQLLRASYNLLSTLSLSQECMGILWKSNFLHEFSTLSPNKPKKSKIERAAEGMWLDLLVNLSFSSEGQNMILKLKDSTGLLLEFGLNGNEHHQKCAALVIRNMCFHTSNKPKLLANDKLLPYLLRSLEMGSAEVKSIVCSALLALVHNSQKAKGCLKNTHILRKLQDAHNHFVNMTQAPWAENCSNNLRDILILLKS